MLGLSLFLGVFWFLGGLGPENVDFNETKFSTTTPEDIKKLQDESIELEIEFENIMALREANPEDVLILKKALDKQSAYMDAIELADSDGRTRLVNLDNRYQDIASRELSRNSLEFEVEAAGLEADGQYFEARSKYGEAFEEQKKINNNYPLSPAYNISRAIRLERQVRHLTAKPLARRSLEFEKKADEFIEAQNWKQAEEELNKAVALQSQLNREYRDTNQASSARIEELRIKLVGIQSGQDYTEIVEAAESADKLRAANENLEAARLYEKAARLQTELNETFPDSPYASSDSVAEYERKSQTAESFQLGVQIEQNYDLVKLLISQRKTYEASKIIARLRLDIKHMLEVFPKSSLTNEDLQIKVRYLNLIQNDLSLIQDQVYASLLPIPGAEEGLLMMRTEVPQTLFTLVMGSNPSRNQGDHRPVDSVSWTESKKFCERLSWILGRPVRLPTENEFRQALGPLRHVVLENHVWNHSNSEGTPRDVATLQPFASGFYDLLGNVGEWLESVDQFAVEDARYIGGHANERLEAIFRVPIRALSRGERNRMTGFRFVVDTR